MSLSLTARLLKDLREKDILSNLKQVVLGQSIQDEYAVSTETGELIHIKRTVSVSHKDAVAGLKILSQIAPELGIEESAVDQNKEALKLQKAHEMIEAPEEDEDIICVRKS